MCRDVIVFTKCKELLPSFIDINDTRIERESQIKLLGITTYDKLKFNKHIDILCKNAARQINVLYRFSGIFDLKEGEVIHLSPTTEFCLGLCTLSESQ